MLVLAYSYGCVMAVLPEPLAAKVRGFAFLIPDNDIYDDGSGEKGRETESHITIKYGLHTDDPEDVRDVLEDEGPIEATLRGMSAFHGDKYVVLKLDVDSPDLFRMNRVISDGLECTDTYPQYKPHVTVAYLRHRPDNPYWYRKLFCDMFDGQQVMFDKVKFAPAEGSKVWLPLDGPRVKVAARVAMVELVARRFVRTRR